MNERTKIETEAFGNVYISAGMFDSVIIIAPPPGSGEKLSGFTLTASEWDAFVAAGNAALGRPAPASPSIAERIEIAASTTVADASKLEKGPMRWEMMGRAEGLRMAAGMPSCAAPARSSSSTLAASKRASPSTSMASPDGGAW